MKIFATLISILITLINANAQQEKIVIWHAFDGPLLTVFEKIIEDFNKSNQSIKVIPIKKGNYDDTLNTFLENPSEPDIVQIFEMGTAVMQEKNNFTSIDDVFSWISQPVPNFKLAAASFYKAHGNRLQCLPFNMSTVVMFYNKTVLDELGCEPPKTFEEFETISNNQKIEKDVSLTLASGWLSGHHMDQIGAIHNIPIASHGNGVDSKQAEIVPSEFFVMHWSKLMEWYQKGFFSLETGPDAEKAFANGKIIFISQGSNRLPLLEKSVNNRFKIGVTEFPYWKKIGDPGKTIAGGAAFWVTKKDFSENKKIAIAEFMAFLVSAETQRLWQEKTGYLTVIDIEPSDNLPKATKVAEDAYTKSEPLEFNRGILLQNFPKIRALIVSEMTKTIKGEQTAKSALVTIVSKGNDLLKQLK